MENFWQKKITFIWRIKDIYVEIGAFWPHFALKKRAGSDCKIARKTS